MIHISLFSKQSFSVDCLSNKHVHWQKLICYKKKENKKKYTKQQEQETAATPNSVTISAELQKYFL